MKTPQRLCQFFVRGRCGRANCDFKHPSSGSVSQANNRVCKFFEKSGNCQFGDNCRFFHDKTRNDGHKSDAAMEDSDDEVLSDSESDEDTIISGFTEHQAVIPARTVSDDIDDNPRVEEENEEEVIVSEEEAADEEDRQPTKQCAKPAEKKKATPPDEMPKRKRGRPRKDESLPRPAAPGAKKTQDFLLNDSLEPVRRKRGRPRKATSFPMDDHPPRRRANNPNSITPRNMDLDLPEFDPRKFKPDFVPPIVRKGDTEYAIVVTGVKNTGLCGKYWGDQDNLPSRRRSRNAAPVQDDEEAVGVDDPLINNNEEAPPPLPNNEDSNLTMRPPVPRSDRGAKSVFAPYNNYKWTYSGRDDDNDGSRVDSVSFSEVLRVEKHLVSFLRVRGHSSTNMSSTNSNNVIFVVIEGDLRVILHTYNRRFNAGKGDSFHVPPNCFYTLVNEKVREIEVTMFQFTGSPPKNSAANPIS